MAQWMRNYAPENDAQRFLVGRLVNLSWKLERGDAVEEALALDLIDEAEEAAEARRQEEVARLAEKLPKEWAATARALRTTSAGCHWLLAEFEKLREHIAAHHCLYAHQRLWLLNMLGKEGLDAVRADPVAVRWIPVLVGATYGRQPNILKQVSIESGNLLPVWMHRDEYWEWMQKLADMVLEVGPARERLKAYLDEAVAAIKQQLVAALKRERRRRATAVQRARIDLSAPGKSLLSYQLGNERAFQGVQRRIDAMQSPKPARRSRKATVTAVTTEAPVEVPSVELEGEEEGITTETGEAMDTQAPCADFETEAEAAVETADEAGAEVLATDGDTPVEVDGEDAGFLTTEAKNPVWVETDVADGLAAETRPDDLAARTAPPPREGSPTEADFLHFLRHWAENPGFGDQAMPAGAWDPDQAPFSYDVSPGPDGNFGLPGDIAERLRKRVDDIMAARFKRLDERRDAILKELDEKEARERAARPPLDLSWMTQGRKPPAGGPEGDTVRAPPDARPQG
jgi:hypothetical protein